MGVLVSESLFLHRIAEGLFDTPATNKKHAAKQVNRLLVEVILFADRGFADQKFFRFLEETLKFKYIIRMKSNTTIIHQDTKNKASLWLKKDSKVLQLKQAFLTL